MLTGGHSWDRLPPDIEMRGGSSQPWLDNFVSIEEVPTRLCSWNGTSLRAHSCLLPLHSHAVMAIQETRLTESHAEALKKQVSKQGLDLIVGPCPGWRRRANSWRVDWQHPGMAFTVSRDVPYRLPTSIPIYLDRWYKAGRLLAIDILLARGWTQLVNVYLPVDYGQRQAMLEDLAKYVVDMSDQMAIILGDLNEPVDSNLLACTSEKQGWRNLGAEGSPTPTWVFGATQTAIDSIFVSPVISDMATTLQAHPMPAGHYMISACLEVITETAHELVVDAPSHLVWPSRSSEEDIPASMRSKFRQCCECGDLDQAWDKWNDMVRHITTHSHPQQRGKPPRMRKSGPAQAVCAQQDLLRKWQLADEDARVELARRWRQEQDKARRASLREWKRKMAASLKAHGREFFRWLRGPVRHPSRGVKDHEGMARSRQESLSKLASYWKAVTGTKPAYTELPYVEAGNLFAEELPATAMFLKRSTRSVQEHAAMGLDGWRASEWKSLPPFLLAELARLFHACRAFRRTPCQWLPVRIACIPKTAKYEASPEDYRPVSIACLAYRTFSKWLLASVPEHVIQAIDSACVGGIPHREGIQAWYHIAMRSEASLLEEDSAPLYGASIDCHKFFDFVDASQAAGALTALGFPHSLVDTWLFWATEHQRYYSYAGVIEGFPTKVARGIPQGCPFAMVAANALLSSWVQTLGDLPIYARTFVDDRILLTDQQEALQEAVTRTEEYDISRGLFSKIKSATWSTNSTHPTITWSGGEPLKTGLDKYLGLPLLFLETRATSWFSSIVDNVVATARRAALAGRFGEDGDKVVKMKLCPMLTYSAVVARPTESQFQRMQTAIRSLCWKGRQWAHWGLVLLFVKTLQLDVKTMCVIRSWLTFHRFLKQHPETATPQWVLKWTLVEAKGNVPRRQGPVTNLARDLRHLGLFIEGEFKTKLVDEVTQEYVLIGVDRQKKIQRFFEKAAERKLLSTAQERKKLKGIEHCDIAAVQASIRHLPRSHPLRGAAISIVTDALPTGHRRHAAGFLASPSCCFCDCHDEDQEHILWKCPYWQKVRDSWPTTYSPDWPSCMRHALIPTEEIMQQLGPKWVDLLKGAATLVKH